MDFDQAEAQRPVQQLELTPDDLSPDGIVALNYVKYQNVQNLIVSTAELSIRVFTNVPVMNLVVYQRQPRWRRNHCLGISWIIWYPT